MSKTSQILKIEPPDALGFTGPFTEVVTSTLTLTNPSESKVAFKVKTTAPKRYCVRPNSGVLNRHDSITVSVMLQPFEFDPAEKNKHKFMIQSLVMHGDIEEKEVWKDADPEKLMDTKLRVIFENDVSAPVNDLDTTSEAVHMTPQKANVRANVGGGKTNDDEFSKAKEENVRLNEEVAKLKEESQRLRRIAMSDTMSASAPLSQQQQQQVPSGVGLLFHDPSNIFILIILFIATFTAGLLLSDSIVSSS